MITTFSFSNEFLTSPLTELQLVTCLKFVENYFRKKRSVKRGVIKDISPVTLIIKD